MWQPFSYFQIFGNNIPVHYIFVVNIDLLESDLLRCVKKSRCVWLEFQHDCLLRKNTIDLIFLP